MAESETLENERGGCCNKWNRRLGNRATAAASAAARRNSGIRSAKTAGERIKVSRKLGRSLDDHVRVWIAKKMESSGVSESECRLPFLVKAPRMACFICRQKGYWRCIRCFIASHTKCAPWPDKVRYFRSQLRRAVCWRHPTDWRFEKSDVSTSITETESCGWGLAAAEPILEGDFVVEYIGEGPFILEYVLQEFSQNGEPENSTYVYRNVNGETRAGLFATQSIEAGRELTFDYR
ncbi:hypothetical protein Scep_023488 [Stephania cephalantha]|uniref:SET domain-containing protein n=1 Tax=Stephania cephalantha TaxID=152367 RepID=A0AAP0F1Y2_9MAGN